MRRLTMAMLMATLAGGCLRVQVEPVEVKPITLDVNLKIDRQLDDFFAFEQPSGPATAATSPASTMPVSTNGR